MDTYQILLLTKISKLVLTTLKLKKDEEKIHFINYTANG